MANERKLSSKNEFHPEKLGCMSNTVARNMNSSSRNCTTNGGSHCKQSYQVLVYHSPSARARPASMDGQSTLRSKFLFARAILSNQLGNTWS